MNERISIRSVKREDYGGVRELYHLSIQINSDGFIQDISHHGCIIDKMRSWRKSGGDLLVATRGARVVGMGALAPVGSGTVELCKLHVAPHHQGMGIGRRLAERLIRRAQRAGFTTMELHVTVTQKAAIGLYRRLAFREVKQEVYRTSVFGQELSFNTLYMSLPLPQRDMPRADGYTELKVCDKITHIAVTCSSASQMSEL